MKTQTLSRNNFRFSDCHLRTDQS